MLSVRELDDFPRPGSKENELFHGAMQQLEKYAEIMRKHGGGEIRGISSGERKRAAKHLASAIETLMNFKSKYGDDMSRLQLHLIGYILQKITALSSKLENGSGGNEL